MCKKHITEASSAEFAFSFSLRKLEQSDESDADDFVETEFVETEKNSSDEECIEQFVPPVPNCDDVFSNLDTDAGVPFKKIDVDFAKKNMEVIVR